MRYLDDYAPGQVIELGSRSLTQDEIVDFARQFDPQPFHVDEAAARRSIYGGIIASGWHTVATLMRLMVDGYLSKVASMGSPGVDQIRWLKPVRPGDTLTARGVVQGVKRSTSKPDRGVVDVRYEVFNQKGERVMTMQGMSLMGARDAAGDRPTTA
jgi:acyl dehydratase